MSTFHEKKAIDMQTKTKVRLFLHGRDGSYRVLHRASGETMFEPETNTPIIADPSMIGPGRRFVLE